MFNNLTHLYWVLGARGKKIKISYYDLKIEGATLLT